MNVPDMSPLYYFWLFLKASLLSTGGMGNLPFLHTDLIRLGWAAEPDFVTALAVGQLSPGPSGLWSISLGYLTSGWVGAGLSLAALALPTLLVLAVAVFYEKLERQVWVQNFTRGLALGVVGLSLATTYILAQSVVTDLRGVIIAAAALILALTKRVPVIVILALAALAGMVVYGI